VAKKEIAVKKYVVKLSAEERKRLARRRIPRDTAQCRIRRRDRARFIMLTSPCH
jgi:hypothetical protein